MDGGRDGTAWPGRYDLTIRQTPLFSPDSRHVIAGVSLGGQHMVVVDGVEGARYDTALPYNARIVFDSPRSFHYLAIRGNTWYLVQETIE